MFINPTNKIIGYANIKCCVGLIGDYVDIHCFHKENIYGRDSRVKPENDKKNEFENDNKK